MSALSTIHPTLLDFMQSLGPDDRVRAAIEVLNQTNEVLDDMVNIEGNELTGHTSIVRTGIPAPTWRKMYGGVQPTKSTRAQVTDSCGMLANYSEIDKALADLNGNSAAFRASEHMAVLEGFNQEVCSSLFYANEDTEPEAFTGFAPRFNALSGVENAENVITGGGSSNCTSIWLIVWGENAGAFTFRPKGSVGGFTIQDKGQQTAENIDGSNGRAEIYRTYFEWKIGLAVPDWRYIVRVPNIDVTALVKDAATGGDIIDLMTQALERVQGLNAGRPAFYVNRTIKSFLRRQMNAAVKNSSLTIETIGGKPVMTFGGVPVRRVDALNNSETAVA